MVGFTPRANVFLVVSQPRRFIAQNDKGMELGAHLRGRTATQRSKKGSEKVLERALGKGFQKGSEKGVCDGFYSKEGF